MSELTRLGLDASHSKTELPKVKRNFEDKMDLVKAGLVLDVLTMGKLKTLVEKIENMNPESAGSAQLAELESELKNLRNAEYRQHPVKLYTDMGFSSNKSLEASYEAIKSYCKAFHKVDHAVNVTLRTALQATDQATLNTGLKQAVASLGVGESLTISRNYGGSVATAFVPSQSLPVPPVPIAGAGSGRSYSLSLARRDDSGINIDFDLKSNITGNLGLATGHNLLENLMGKEDLATPVNDEHEFAPEFRLGTSVLAKLNQEGNNKLSLTIREDEVNGFIDALSHGDINPEEILKRGFQQKVSRGHTVRFDIDANADAYLRANISQADAEESPLNMIFRAAIGIKASVNLLSATRERGHSQSKNQRGKEKEESTLSHNRPRVFNKVSASVVGMIGTLGIQRSDAGILPVESAVSAEAAVSLNNLTNKNVVFSFEKASPIEESDLDSIITALKNSYKDKDSRSVFDNMNPLDSVGEKLAGLNNYFANKVSDTDDQYAAKRKLLSAVVQNSAARNNCSFLSDASCTTTYTNLSRLDHMGLLTRLGALVNPDHARSNAERISQLAADNTTLRDLIKALQTQPNCKAQVSLELKDTVRDRIEKGSLERSMTQSELVDLLKNPDNLRLKSIAVTRSVSLNEGFTSPTLFAGYTSSASVGVEKILGKINFEYGRDQDVPKSFTLEGDQTKPDPNLVSAFAQLAREGYGTNV